MQHLDGTRPLFLDRISGRHGSIDSRGMGYNGWRCIFYRKESVVGHSSKGGPFSRQRMVFTCMSSFRTETFGSDAQLSMEERVCSVVAAVGNASRSVEPSDDVPSLQPPKPVVSVKKLGIERRICEYRDICFYGRRSCEAPVA